MIRYRSDRPPTEVQPCSLWCPRIRSASDLPTCGVCSRRRYEDYAVFYSDSSGGQPTIPPSMIVYVMLLQYHDCSETPKRNRGMRSDLSS
jgi:hypothetical protein